MNALSSIALNGLSYASARLTRSAQNTANININTDGYQAEREVAQAVAGGGVTGTAQPTRAAAPSYDRDGADVLGSNTDLISEQVEQLGARQQFQASVALLKTDQDMTQSLLDLKA